MVKNGLFGTPFLTPKISPKMFMWLPFCVLSQEMRHTTFFSGGPKWGVLGGGQKVYVLFPSPTQETIFRLFRGLRPGDSCKWPTGFQDYDSLEQLGMHPHLLERCFQDGPRNEPEAGTVGTVPSRNRKSRKGFCRNRRGEFFRISFLVDFVGDF